MSKDYVIQKEHSYRVDNQVFSTLKEAQDYKDWLEFRDYVINLPDYDQSNSSMKEIHKVYKWLRQFNESKLIGESLAETNEGKEHITKPD